MLVFSAEHPRIRSLRNPTQKMSKSAPHASSKILLTDTPEMIRDAIRTALTDPTQGVTWDPENRPGIAGLLQIYSGYSGEDVEAIARRYNGLRGIQELKESLTEVISESLKSFRSEYDRVRSDEGYLRERESIGRDRARETASKVMAEVRALAGTD